MEDLARFGISIPKELLKAFDEYIEKKHYANRSEAIRDLIRQKLVEEEWKESKEEVMGVIMYLYDHHKRELTDRLMEIQHNYYERIITTQHIHIDHAKCLEVISTFSLFATSILLSIMAIKIIFFIIFNLFYLCFYFFGFIFPSGTKIDTSEKRYKYRKGNYS